MKQNRQIRYINIQEARHLYLIGGSPHMEVIRSASVHEIMSNSKKSRKSIRLYTNISDASILRLAKIQEKLAK